MRSLTVIKAGPRAPTAVLATTQAPQRRPITRRPRGSRSLISTCKPEYEAGHYALGSAFISVFSALFGGMGAVIVEDLGYLGLFIIGFAASIPAMALLFFLQVRN